MKRVVLAILAMLVLVVIAGGSLYIYYKYPIALLFPVIVHGLIWYDMRRAPFMETR